MTRINGRIPTKDTLGLPRTNIGHRLVGSRGAAGDVGVWEMVEGLNPAVDGSRTRWLEPTAGHARKHHGQ